MSEPTQSSRATFSVRPAETSDARLLSQFGARLFEQSFGSVNDPEDIRIHVTTAFSIEAMQAALADRDVAVWIAEDAGNAAIGYAMLRRGSTAAGLHAAKPAEVQRIYVERAWYGQRVGEALMRACVDQATTWHSDVLWLGVWQKNPRAIAFYEKNGFGVVGEQTFMLGRDAQRDFVMARPLA